MIHDSEIIPKETFSEMEASIKPSSENAKIVLSHGGKKEMITDATPGLVRALNPDRPHYSKKRYEVVKPDGETKKAWEPLPEGKLGRSVQPHVQLTYKATRRAGKADPGYIHDYLVNEERALPPEDYADEVLEWEEYSKEMVNRMIESMFDRGLLFGRKDEFEIDREVEYDKPLEDYSSGYDPRQKGLLRYIRSSRVSRKKIHDILFRVLGWAKPPQVDVIIEILKLKGVLEPTGGEKMFSVKPDELEPYPT